MINEESQTNSEIGKMIAQIREDREHGASFLSQRAVETLKRAANESRAKNVEDFLAEMKVLGSELIKIRPSMVPIMNRISNISYLLSEE